MSLRDELLKAGLVSREKAKKAETHARKHTHRAKKDKALAAAEAARSNEEQRKREAEAERLRERDRALNREREAKRERRALLARVRQLIEGHRLNEPDAEIRYNFLAAGRFIRYVRVTPQQQRQLARGLIGIASNDKDEYDFPLIPRETALKLAEMCPERLLLLYPESRGHEEDDSWETS